MARLLKGIPPEFVARKLYPYWHPMHDTFPGSRDDRDRLEEEAMALIEARATVVEQQVADSYAYYEVVQRQPLLVRCIPFRDCWEGDPAWIRGLNLSDVQRQERFDTLSSA